jgi:hypothetical protein
MMKKIVFGLLFAGVACGCSTVFPPVEDDDRGVVAPETTSDEKSKAGDPVLPEMKPWWHY